MLVTIILNDGIYSVKFNCFAYVCEVSDIWLWRGFETVGLSGGDCPLSWDWASCFSKAIGIMRSFDPLLDSFALYLRQNNSVRE